MEALKSLPSCPRLSDPAINKPESLKEWLELLCLSEYFDVFQHNGFTSMDRIHMLWEVELTSVSYLLEFCEQTPRSICFGCSHTFTDQSYQEMLHFCTCTRKIVDENAPELQV